MKNTGMNSPHPFDPILLTDTQYVKIFSYMGLKGPKKLNEKNSMRPLFL